MKKIHLGPAVGELEDGSAPAMSIGVATERTDGVELTLSGLIHPEGTTTEQAETIFEIIEDIVVNDLDGRVADITLLRFYVREENLTAEVRSELHELRRELFDAPEYPAATMIGVASLVHDDATIEIEAEALIPNEMWEIETVEPEDD